MAFNHRDFELTPGQIEEINRYITSKAAAYVAEGEDPPDSVVVEFQWTPAFGRMVQVYFDGAREGHLIDGFDVTGKA